MKKLIALLLPLLIVGCNRTCPDKNVIITHKMICIEQRDTTKWTTKTIEVKWHVRGDSVVECYDGEDRWTDAKYIDGKIVEEDELCKFIYE